MNIGSLTQLVLEGSPTADIRDFVEFTARVGLPNTLTEVGWSVDNARKLDLVAEASTVPGETMKSMPFDVGTADVVAALKSIERFSRRVRREAGLSDPVPYKAH